MIYRKYPIDNMFHLDKTYFLTLIKFLVSLFCLTSAKQNDNWHKKILVNVNSTLQLVERIRSKMSKLSRQIRILVAHFLLFDSRRSRLHGFTIHDKHFYDVHGLCFTSKHHWCIIGVHERSFEGHISSYWPWYFLYVPFKN